LCEQDEADQDSQALAGLLKGTLSVARIRIPNPVLVLRDGDNGEIPANLSLRPPAGDELHHNIQHSAYSG
jgi:hypothetical protein